MTLEGPTARRDEQKMVEQSWVSLVAIRRYMLATFVGNLLWETAQLPFYRIWYHAGAVRLVSIVIMGVTGDIAIAGTVLILALCLYGADRWPERNFLPVACLVMMFGVLYTLVSEAVHVRLGMWHYAAIMPRLPLIGVGLTPVLEWLVVPGFALFWLQLL